MKKKIRVFGALFGMSVLLTACGKEIDTVTGDTVTQTPIPTAGQEQTEKPETTREPEKEPAVSPEPAEAKLVYRLETEEASAKDGDRTIFTSCLVYPVFEGEGAEALNTFITSLTADFRAYLPGAEAQARLDYEDFQGEDFFLFPEEEELTVGVTAETEQWISFQSTWYSNTGGIHPNIYCKAHVKSKADGSEVQIEDYLKQYGLTPEEVAEYAAGQVLAFEDPEIFWNAAGLSDSFLTMLKENQWYLTEEGIMLFANPYEIAAYAYGRIECEISYEVLRQGLKNN
ncbi:MAG: DUF3298 domain-containing protein [Lachnospiraceae bacterium]